MAEPRVARDDRPPGSPRLRAGGLLAGVLGGLLAATGCTEVDGWLWDPSVTGRWEQTPTIVPVLERIDVIESGEGEFVELTEVRPDDLVPRPIEYTVEPGDFLEITIFDYLATGVPSLYQVPVDPTGYIDLPQLDPIFVQGLTAQQIQQKLAEAIIEAGILNEPEVSATVPGPRQAVFSIFGAVPRVNTYPIPFPDFRLLDGITLAGGVSPVIRSVYVIRKVDLATVGTDARRPSEADPIRDGGTTPDDGPSDDILDLIDERFDEPDQPPPPGVFASQPTGGAPLRRDPAAPIDLDGVLPADLTSPAVDPARLAQDTPPLIDLDGGQTTLLDHGRDPIASTDEEGRWVFRGGRWQRVADAPAPGPGLPEGQDPLEAAVPTAEDLITQRVIEIPVTPLLQGVAQYNIVIRPGDVINVPSPDVGVVYIGGPGINRPGTYTLNGTTSLTLQRAVMAAGGFSQIAIPERVDVTRMIGNDRQATIRLNARAIFEGTAPDIVLRPDDIVNFGTSFWATPLAIVRGGFRMTYGFGFLLDRNFGNDVFGPPPSSEFNN